MLVAWWALKGGKRVITFGMFSMFASESAAQRAMQARQMLSAHIERDGGCQSRGRGVVGVCPGAGALSD